MRVSRRLAGAAAVMACGVAAALLLRPDGEPKRVQARREASSIALGPGGRELAALLERGKAAVFHARYKAVTQDPAATGQELSMELWRRAPQERFDVTVSAQGRQAVSSVFRLSEATVACTREGEQAWTCRPVSAAGPSAPDALIARLAEETKGRTFTVRHDRINDTPVRCFTVALDAYPAEVCVTTSGVPARVSAGPSRIELVELDSSVAADVFSPPAAPA